MFKNVRKAHQAGVKSRDLCKTLSGYFILGVRSSIYKKLSSEVDDPKMKNTVVVIGIEKLTQELNQLSSICYDSGTYNFLEKIAYNIGRGGQEVMAKESAVNTQGGIANIDIMEVYGFPLPEEMRRELSFQD